MGIHSPSPCPMSLNLKLSLWPYVISVTQSRKVEWWNILTGQIIILSCFTLKWLHNPPCNFTRLCNRFSLQLTLELGAIHCIDLYRGDGLEHVQVDCIVGHVIRKKGNTSISLPHLIQLCLLPGRPSLPVQEQLQATFSPFKQWWLRKVKQAGFQLTFFLCVMEAYTLWHPLNTTTTTTLKFIVSAALRSCTRLFNSSIM